MNSNFAMAELPEAYSQSVKEIIVDRGRVFPTLTTFYYVKLISYIIWLLKQKWPERCP